MSDPLSKTHPDIAGHWHPTKTGNLTPDQVPARSSKKVWWRCPAGPDHEWKASVARRTIYPSCPFFENRRLSVTNSLSELHPEIASLWHPDLNGDLTPDRIIVNNSKQVLWKCPNGPDHEWQTLVRRLYHYAQRNTYKKGSSHEAV